LHNAAQLRLLRMLFNDAFPNSDFAIDRLYNWHPKDWRTCPSYTLVDQTDKFSEKAALNCIALYKELYPDVEEKKTLKIGGIVLLDTDDESAPSPNYTITPIKELVQKAIDEGTFGQTKYDYFDSYFTENFE
jgi:hypothetical protein